MSHGPCRVAGKIALATGAASGIGRAAAQTLAEHGASLLCADLNLAGAQETAQRITTAGGSASAYLLDVTAEAAWQGVMEHIVRRHGRLDVLVNCAGISATGAIADLPLADWRRVLAVNLEGVLLGTQHAIRVMRRHGQGGSIINISSISGIKAQPGAAASCTSKAAIRMLSRVAALECQQHGDRIRVNTVCPGGVKTPMWRTEPFFQELMAQTGSEEGAFQAMLQGHPHARFAEPEEIALGILYLASDESRYVTGTDLVIDNGGTA